MAMIQCPECNKEISDQARSCPGCGYPLRPDPAVEALRRLRSRLLAFGLAGCGIGLPVGLILGIPYVWGLSVAGIVIVGLRLMTRSRGEER